MSYSHPCDTCPWRCENQGKPHVDGWYTKANLKRLWSKIRNGETMSCHKTDDRIDNNLRPVPEGTKTRECAGGAILQQREFMRMQRIMNQNGVVAPFSTYSKVYRGGITKSGAQAVIERHVLGAAGMARLGPNLKVDLNEPGISHPALIAWDEKEEGKA